MFKLIPFFSSVLTSGRIRPLQQSAQHFSYVGRKLIGGVPELVLNIWGIYSGNLDKLVIYLFYTYLAYFCFYICV